jgi:hypothetical protein
MPVIPMKRGDFKAQTLLPDGTYAVRVAKATMVDVNDPNYKGQAKADYINLDLVITDEGEVLGRHVFHILTLDPEKGGQTRQFLDAVDYPEDEDLDTDALVERECLAVVGREIAKPGSGYEDRNRVKKFLSPV